MGKTFKGADKAAKKAAEARRKVAAKTKRALTGLAILGTFLGLLCISGCATSGPQPARSQNQTNNYRDCRITINVRGGATNDVPALELWTNTQSNEGSESNAPTATPTNTTTPTTTLSYGGKAAAARGLLEQIVGLFDGKSGSTTSTATDAADCSGGDCTPSDDCAGGVCTPN